MLNYAAQNTSYKTGVANLDNERQNACMLACEADTQCTECWRNITV